MPGPVPSKCSQKGVIAEEACSPLVDRGDSRMQLGAASPVPVPVPVLRGRWLYADHKLVVGRAQDVWVSPDGATR